MVTEIDVLATSDLGMASHTSWIAAAACPIACVQMNPSETLFAAYASYLGGMLADQVMITPGKHSDKKELVTLLHELAQQCELLVFEEPERPLWARLLAIWPGCQTAVSCHTSVLVVRQPHWPIKRVLLIVRADGGDEMAVQWAGRLVYGSGAELTILTVVPALPAMYSFSHNVQAGLDVLLAPNTNSGCQLRQIAQQLAGWHVGGTLRLRQGEPDWQIRLEVEEGDYDLVIIAAERNGRLHRWLVGDLVTPLLHWIDRPVLIAKMKDEGDRYE